ncbi:hypothetical protein U1Q18_000341 [Sarracenia purpurea var. burkii]
MAGSGKRLSSELEWWKEIVVRAGMEERGSPEVWGHEDRGCENRERVAKHGQRGWGFRGTDLRLRIVKTRGCGIRERVAKQGRCGFGGFRRRPEIARPGLGF